MVCSHEYCENLKGIPRRTNGRIRDKLSQPAAAVCRNGAPRLSSENGFVGAISNNSTQLDLCAFIPLRSG